jgi:hypothetical protein
MTIKQQGGVFGRNPTFNDVAYLTTDEASAIRCEAGEIEFRSAPSGTAGAAMTLTQYAKFTTAGNLAFVSGKGIDFSATAGTGTSELLDDYEEGTWTPAYGADGGDPTVTYSTQSGTYTKIGRVVTITCSLVINTVSGGSGTLRIYGLPFTNGTNTSGLTNGFVYNFVTSPQQYNIGAGLNSILLYQNTLTNTLSTAADLQASAYLYISGSYTV